TRDATPASIARMMVGRDVALALEAGSGKREAGSRNLDAASAPALRVKNLGVAGTRRPRAVDDGSFDIAPGELFGIAGVEGNGQTELIDAITGLREIASGTIELGVDQDTIRELTTLTVRERGDGGVSHIPEDRHHRGLVLEYSVADNLILGQQHHYTQ